MRDNGVDMWMHVIRDGNPDPLALDLGTPLDLRGTTSYFIFTDRGSERIERAVLGGRNEGIREGDGEIYDFFGASTDLRQFVQARDPQAIAVNTSTSVPAGGVYEAIENHSAHRSPRVLIPPRKGALLASGPASSRQRNRNIAAQARLGKRKWHTESGYSKRSKVETTFHRYKAIVGSAMRARGLAAQRVEARIGCKILNTMTALGMPDSEMIG